MAGRAVERADAQRVADGVALVERLRRGPVIVERIGPAAAGGIEGEAAIDAVEGGRGGKRRLAVVDIADRQLAGGIRIAAAGRTRLDRRPIVGDRRIDDDRSRIVGAGDGDDDVVAGRAVERADAQRVADGVALVERLRRGPVIVERIGPAAAGGIEGEAAIDAVEGGRGGKRRLAVVDIADRQLAGGIRIAAAGRTRLDRRPIVGDRRIDDDRSRIVGAGDGDDDVVAGRAVERADAQRVADGVALVERLRRGPVIVERIGPAAAGGIEGEAAIDAVEGGRGGKRRLAVVDIADRQLAGGIRIAAAGRTRLDRRPIVGDRRIDDDRSRIVGAGDGDDDVVAGRAVERADAQRVADGVALVERLRRGPVIVERIGPAAAGGIEGEAAIDAVEGGRAANAASPSSTSLTVSLPEAFGSPLPAAPASTVARSSVTVASTTIEAASLAPVMATTMLWLAVPSSELTLSVSLTASPWLSACVAARLLSSV